MLGLNIVVFGLAWWLGLYILAREPARLPVRRAGVGLVAYALALATDVLVRARPPGILAAQLTTIHWMLVLLPALLWIGAFLQLLPDDQPLHDRLDRLWRMGLVPLLLAGILLASASGHLVTITPAGATPGPAFAPLVVLVLLPLLIALGLLWRSHIAGPPLT